MKKRPMVRSILFLACAALLCALICGAGADSMENERKSYVFGILKDVRLTASSGAGAWEGTLQVDSEGNFTGDYYDADYDEVQRVFFSGTFGEVLAVNRTTWLLTVTDAATEQAPGTEEYGEDGIRIVYTKTLLPAGSQWLLTLPGTPENSVPETVRGEIFGTFWEEFNPAAFITLSDTKDGWGFFAKVSEDISKRTAVRVPDPGQDSVSPDTPALRPIDGKPGCLEVPVASISATSYLTGKEDPNEYSPERMIDGIDETCWQFSTNVTALGDACIHIYFSEPSHLDELWMKNGFWKVTAGYDQYTRNCRIKKMEVDYRYEYGGYQDGHIFVLKDDKARKDWKVLTLKAKKDVVEVRIRVLDVYRGAKFRNDVAVSEIMFVQKEK